MPTDPRQKVQVFLDLALTDCANENWMSAESNLRLALTFDPRNLEAQRRLKEVVATRDAIRRKQS